MAFAFAFVFRLGCGVCECWIFQCFCFCVAYVFIQELSKGVRSSAILICRFEICVSLDMLNTTQELLVSTVLMLEEELE